jgi:hypothetical protein
MCVANISGVLGDMFRFIYSRIFCRFCYIKTKKRSEKDQNVMHNNLDIMNTGVIDTVVPYGDEHRISGNYHGNQLKPMNGYDDKSKGILIDEEIVEEDDDDKVTVPLTITMIIITGYIAIGAVLFHKFEQWTLIQSAYFCFITLATIGRLH